MQATRLQHFPGLVDYRRVGRQPLRTESVADVPVVLLLPVRQLPLKRQSDALVHVLRPVPSHARARVVIWRVGELES